MADEQTFGSVSLFAGGITSQGALRLGADKVEWKKAGGGRSVAIAKADVGEVTYSQIPGGVSLTVRSKGTAPAMRMKGFRGSDMATVKEAMKALDHNSDGTIDAAELTKCLREFQRKRRVRQKRSPRSTDKCTSLNC